MFMIATITDKGNAPKVRRELRKQGFSYNRIRREWVKNCMTIRGARLDLPEARAIGGAEIALRTVSEMQTIIETRIKERIK